MQNNDLEKNDLNVNETKETKETETTSSKIFETIDTKKDLTDKQLNDKFIKYGIYVTLLSGARYFCYFMYGGFFTLLINNVKTSNSILIFTNILCLILIFLIKYNINKLIKNCSKVFEHLYLIRKLREITK